MRDVIQSGDLILSNQTSVLDFLFLEFAYSPVFTAIAFDSETGQVGLRKVGMFETLTFALGLKFPTEVQATNNFFTDLKQL